MIFIEGAIFHIQRLESPETTETSREKRITDAVKSSPTSTHPRHFSSSKSRRR